MTTGRFDYDFLRYGAYADASEIAPGTDLVYEVEPAFSGCLGCAPVSTVVVSAGVPVYCTSPLYDPLCYDPLYWSPGYVPPAYWNTGWGYYDGYYGGGYYGGYYGPSWNASGWGGGHYPYAPGSSYQPKPWARQWNGESPAYRPRAGMENVNTVVGPLPSTGRILRADPRRSWDGSLPIAVPVSAAPVTGGAAKPSQPAPRGQDSDPVVAPKPRDRGEQKASQPAPADPRTRRDWSDDKSNAGGKAPAPAPAPQAGNAGGGRSNPPSTPQAAPSSGNVGSKPSTPPQPSSGGGGRRRG